MVAILPKSVLATYIHIHRVSLNLEGWTNTDKCFVKYTKQNGWVLKGRTPGLLIKHCVWINRWGKRKYKQSGHCPASFISWDLSIKLYHLLNPMVWVEMLIGQGNRDAFAALFVRNGYTWGNAQIEQHMCTHLLGLGRVCWLSRRGDSDYIQSILDIYYCLLKTVSDMKCIYESLHWSSGKC